MAVLLGSGLSTAAGASAADFRRTNYQVLAITPDKLPYHANGAGPLDGTWTYDRHGVSVRVIGGRAFDHPVLQAQFMLTRLSSYRHNGDPRYLARVEAHAERLLANAVHSTGAIYFPYSFDWALHGDRSDLMVAPWYSAMAQGQALSAFVRLHAVTGKTRYADAVEKIFNSFTVRRGAGTPWTTDVERGYLWFEEYAKHPHPDRAFNGHIFAIYGVYDYLRSRRSEVATALFQGAVTTVAAHLSNLRQPGWLSRYCLSHPGHAYTDYHTVHVAQLYQLFRMTGDATFAVHADRMLDDYPAAQLGGRGYLAAGSHQALRLDSGRRVVEVRSFRLPAAEAIAIGSRHRVRGSAGVWLRVDSGTAAGHWIRELHAKAFVKLSTDSHEFVPSRLVRFQAGTYVGFTFNRYGARETSKPFRLHAASHARSTRRTVMNGATYFLIADGVWSGRWMPAQPGVSLT
ncbi:D-glucuronyl C5-epimerase family protein [Pilimelia columellifera]|uniref:D-glucuronyl C5-epimerase family protein n=1 Tax=Pilimelia columellifera TaxID=706574 RepID=UPI0031DE3517